MTTHLITTGDKYYGFDRDDPNLWKCCAEALGDIEKVTDKFRKKIGKRIEDLKFIPIETYPSFYPTFVCGRIFTFLCIGFEREDIINVFNSVTDTHIMQETLHQLAEYDTIYDDHRYVVHKFVNELGTDIEFVSATGRTLRLDNVEEFIAEEKEKRKDESRKAKQELEQLEKELKDSS